MRRMRFHASILLIFPARSPVSRRPLLARPGLRRGGKPVVLVQMDCVGLGLWSLAEQWAVRRSM